MSDATQYTRPNLTPEERYKAEKTAKALIAKYGFGNLPKMLAHLCVENALLVKEIQEHRAARGIEPLPKYEV